MRKWLFFLIIFISGWLQVSLIHNFKLFGIVPDLLLMCVVFASLNMEKKWAFIYSAFSGVLKDSFGQSAFGLNTLFFVIWCFLIIKVTKEMQIDDTLLRMALVFVVSFLHNFVTGIIFFYSGRSFSFGIFSKILFIGSIYTALIFPLFFKAVRPLISKLSYSRLR